MLIILEGPDGAGKSTLAQKLVSEIPNAELLHKGPPKAHPLAEYETPLVGYMPGTERTIICDRWHLGEWVYPEILDRKTQADDVSWHHLDLFMRARGAVLVIMVPTLDVLRKRLITRGDDLVTTGQLAPISRAYTSLRVQTSMSIATSDINNIKRVARYTDAKASQVVHNGSYVGSLSPTMLLVGERRAFAPPYPPSFGPFPATSGHYIFNNLIQVVGDYVTRMGFANAYEEDLAALWKSLYSPKVVALGNLAFNELDAAGVPCGAVPHPQYIRRFHHKHGRWYVNLIRRAANQQEDLRKCRP